jgi:hypothetical protein
LINTGLLLAVGLLSMSAQVPVSKPQPLKVRFYYVGYDTFATGLTSPELQATYGSGKSAREIRLAPESLSPIYDYDGPMPMVLYREVKVEGRSERQTLAELTCPPDWPGVLFMVFPEPQSAGFPFHFTPVEYGADHIPDNSMRLLNLCPVPLAIKLSGEGKVVPPHEQADFPINPDAAMLPFVLARSLGESWKVVISSPRPKPESSRMLMLAFPDYPDFKTVRILQLGNLPVASPQPSQGAH